ncbi:MAG: NAD(P)/FAD-dependent oxidoreductase [Ardenticatenaceae bacterium]|nr:NAD(P)/FAD-dependent oxidoreductase [Ardenticatenaceae bacterium]
MLINEFPAKIIIVGSGPAGSATALALNSLAPELARETIVLEKATHPRVKLCGGGITPYADEVLADLGVSLNIPGFPVDVVRFTAHGVSSEIRIRNLLRIVRREEFDAALAAEVRARGVDLHEGEPVTAIERVEDGVRLTTPAGTYRAQVVVAADGATSMVRQKLVPTVGASRISRLIEVLTPEPDAAALPGFRDAMAVFDYSPVTQGVQGYYWDFPSIKAGQPTMNRGLFDSRVVTAAPRAPLRQIFAEALRARGRRLEAYELQGHPERWFHPDNPFSAPHVLLVGEAAGVEPLAGEGISAALDYGLVAAPAIVAAFDRGDFSFNDYRRRVLTSRVGFQLLWKSRAARVIYRLRHPFIWKTGIRFVALVLTVLVRLADRPEPPGSIRLQEYTDDRNHPPTGYRGSRSGHSAGSL